MAGRFEKKEMKTELDITKHQKLLEFILNRFEYAKKGIKDSQDKWKRFYDNYRGTQIATKDIWQANYVVPIFKEIVRIKVPLYLNILFSNGIKSFDIEPGEIDDEEQAPLVKDVLIYQCRNIGKEKEGFFGQWGGFVKQFEMYGHSVAMCPWKEEKNLKGDTTFDGPDMEVLDIFSYYPDPSSLAQNSWKIVQKRDVFVSYLRQQEELDHYKNIIELKGTHQPAKEDTVGGINIENLFGDVDDDRVELLEYHGEVPKSLIEGDLDEISDIDPYEDEYVEAIVTVGNQKIVIRNEEYKYPCNIFFSASKDKLPNEQFGIGTGEDIEAMARELTNSHNMFSDAVSLICNPMGIINPTYLTGLSGTIVTYPGKMFIANSMVDDVRKAISWIDTTAPAAALSPLIKHIDMIDNRIQKLSHAVPSISPVATKAGLHETLGGAQMQQANAAEPIKDVVNHNLEPAFCNMLSIFYKLNQEFFSEESAFKILGKEKAERWLKLTKKNKITRKDLALKGNPDFIPRGVSIFKEKQIELLNLLKFFELSLKAQEPMLNPTTGQPVMGGDGKPVMQPIGSIAEIMKRCGVALNFGDLEKLIPKLQEMREAKENKVPQPAAPTAGNAMPVPPAGMAGGAQQQGIRGFIGGG